MSRQRPQRRKVHGKSERQRLAEVRTALKRRLERQEAKRHPASQPVVIPGEVKR